MNTEDMKLLVEIHEHFDGIADGAPDASYSAKMALQFSEPLKDLIERLCADPVQERLTQADRLGDRAWDEEVAKLRAEGLIGS